LRTTGITNMPPMMNYSVPITGTRASTPPSQKMMAK
jgi:hypothetical protein